MARATLSRTAQRQGQKQERSLSSESSRRPVPSGSHAEILALQGAAGNRAVNQLLRATTSSPVMIQAKLTIGKPGDKYEQEADRVAEQVMRMPEPRTPDNSAVKEWVQKPHIQRLCPACEEELQRQPMEEKKEKFLRTKPSIQRRISSAEGSSAAPFIAHDVLRSSGQPLDSATRTFMESRFGHDFSNVRVHTDAPAAETARSINAKAFTLGKDVVFGVGQYAPESSAGRRLLAHELMHVVQQAPLLQRQPDPDTDTTNVDACLKQTKDLLPGKVGLVEDINREVWLDEAIGKERQNLEAQIRQEYDARKFVCEAGVPAMLALFYNRDYRNRLQVNRARKSFAQHPEVYSSAGFDKFTNTKAFLTKKYRITIEPGDKAWSPEDIGLLAEALGKLTDSEIPLIADYRFIRWTNRCNERIAANPNYSCELEDYQTCGFHLAEVVHRDYTISIYDCFKGDSLETAKKDYNVQPGAETIVHEIGHAFEFAKLRLALEKQGDAKREYQRLSKLANAATGNAKASLNQQVTAAKKVMEEADKAMKNAMSPSVLDQFIALTKGKPALTPYSKRNDAEAFAEAFMLFKVAPDKLKKANKPLFNWFAKGGFI